MRVCCAKVQRQQASHPSEAGCMVELTVFSGQVCARRHLAGAFLLWLRTQELSANGARAIDLCGVRILLDSSKGWQSN